MNVTTKRAQIVEWYKAYCQRLCRVHSTKDERTASTWTEESDRNFRALDSHPDGFVSSLLELLSLQQELWPRFFIRPLVPLQLVLRVCSSVRVQHVSAVWRQNFHDTPIYQCELSFHTDVSFIDRTMRQYLGLPFCSYGLKHKQTNLRCNHERLSVSFTLQTTVCNVRMNPLKLIIAGRTLWKHNQILQKSLNLARNWYASFKIKWAHSRSVVFLFNWLK